MGQHLWKPEGRTFNLKETWRGHRWTDEEIARLCEGEELIIECQGKKGPYTARVKIGHCSFVNDKGETVNYIGPDFLGFVASNKPPARWCKHEFTAEELAKLERGEAVFADDFVSSKSGKTFGCDVTWEEQNGERRIVPHFGD